MTTVNATASLVLKFGGWFQCRLATDPDPTDEPRGVDGYMHAVAGEPDLDRIIRLQTSSGVVQRSYCPSVGVKVVSVYVDLRKIDDHPLIGASVDFLDKPRFEGRNTILTAPGAEAIFPVHIQIKKDINNSNNNNGSFIIQRKYDDDMKFSPLTADDLDKFKRLQAIFQSISPGEIEEATGIFDLSVVWSERVAKLQADLTKTTNEIEIAAIKSRIETMSNTSPRRFSVRMLYSMNLKGNAIFEDPNSYLPGKPIGLASADPWTLELWCGAWDADAQSGYMVGYLGLPISLSEKKKNGGSSEVNDAYTHFKYLSEMIDKSSKLRQ
jgi:hypothetical protein